MKAIVIAGGNSGVGLQAAREFLAQGHRVILLGRDKGKGEAALASFGPARERAEFLSVDLSTHDGVRDAARRIEPLVDRIDGLLHSAGVFETRDVRTSDGLVLFFALGYLSKYHLTQLLLPRLLAADQPRVVMLTATLKETPKLDPSIFPYLPDFNFWKLVYQLNGACLYYADYLMKTQPKIFAGCVSPGFVMTDIFKRAPWFIRLMVAVTGPFSAISLEKAAHNPVQAILHGEGAQAFSWNIPGDFEEKFAITVDPAVQAQVMAACRQVTGV